MRGQLPVVLVFLLNWQLGSDAQEVRRGAQELQPRQHVPADTSTAQAYQELLSVRQFAFGGVGFAGVTSRGELAFYAIAARTNDLELFSSALKNGNPQAKIYALCGIRRVAPQAFPAKAKAFRSSGVAVETASGC